MEKLKDGIVLMNEDMSKHSSFHVGGKVARYVSTNMFIEAMSIIVDCCQRRERLFILGGGTNTLFSSKFINATVLAYTNNEIYLDKGNIVCSAGTTVAEFLRFCVKHSISGYEFMAGIPGTMGGAVKGNAGGVDVAIGDYVLGLDVLLVSQKICGQHLTEYLDKKNILIKNKINIKNKIKNIKILNCRIITKKISENAENILKNRILNKKIIKKMYIDKNNLHFAYRKNNLGDNIFIKNIILKCVYGDRERIADNINFNIKKKVFTQPTRDKSAGSVFLREGDFVPAREIDQLGLKGKCIGGASVSDVHAGFIVNSNNATSDDVLDLVQYVRKKVYQKHKLMMKSEIKYFD